MNQNEFTAFLAEGEFGAHVQVPQFSEADKKCGMIGIRRDPASGDVRYFTHRCNNFRDCTICFNHRKGEIIGRVADTIDYHGVTYLTEIFLENEKDYRHYRDKYGSESVMRFPVSNGTVLLIANYEDDGEIHNCITVNDLKKHDQYLSYLSFTPHKKKISGGAKARNRKTKKKMWFMLVCLSLFLTHPVLLLSLSRNWHNRQPSI